MAYAQPTGYLTVNQFAEKWSINWGAVNHLCHMSKLEYIKVGNRLFVKDGQVVKFEQVQDGRRSIKKFSIEKAS